MHSELVCSGLAFAEVVVVYVVVYLRRKSPLQLAAYKEFQINQEGISKANHRRKRENVELGKSFNGDKNEPKRTIAA